MQAMSRKNKELALKVLTDIIQEVVEKVSGVDMQFILFAIPKNKPKVDDSEIGILCGNVPADKVATVLQMAVEVTSRESSIDHMKRSNETAH